MSSATSYVAIEERAEGERTEERAELRRIPVALTRGWGGLAGGLDAILAAAPPVGFTTVSSAARSLVSLDDTLDDLAFAEMAAPEAPAARRKAKSATPEPQAVRGVFYRQRADGSWDLTAELATECGADLDELRAASSSLPHPDGEKILATLLALKLAERLPPRKRKPLAAMLKKAKRWLEKVTAGVPEPEGGWEAWAGRFLA
jgi:hypothetical protein